MLKFRERTNAWPGFVDLFSNLVIVLIFLLIVFVFLWTTTNVFNAKSGVKKVADLTKLSQQQAEQIVQMNADEQEAKRLLILAHAELEHLESTKANLENEVSSLDSTLNAKDSTIEELVVSYEERVKQLQSSSTNMQSMLESLTQQLQNKQIQTEQERIELQNQRNNLEQQLVNLNEQLAQMNAALNAAESKSKQQEVNYIEMSSRLNRALTDKAAEAARYAAEASKYAETAKYQSEFFKAIKLAFMGHSNVDTSSDRFLIPSDILFASGSYELSNEGKNQLRMIAKVIKDMENIIPKNVNWIIRVDGHTDTKPVLAGTPGYKNNVELSLLRARAVAKELGLAGVQRKRLVPSGFGELHPAVPGESKNALQKNRRIELRLTNP